MDGVLAAGLKHLVKSVTGQPFYTDEELARLPHIANIGKLSVDDIFRMAQGSFGETPKTRQTNQNKPNSIESHPTYILISNFEFDEKFNFDFRHMKDRGQQNRGGLDYIRPYGSFRYAIKVLGKYNDDAWLRSDGSLGEWPVAYYGSREEYHAGGMRCTPDPYKALDYAHEFNTENGNYCKLIFQVRVDPKKIIVINKGTDGEYWIVPRGDSIRPYGICIFKNYHPTPSNGSSAAKVFKTMLKE
ncbi:unnamed protein product [Caenorhabditis bovis]|uniref:Uncharacterized protein n=1 Tax=Caenorhabditis bovis TaxID=2654633 RepID=A0A8S1EYN9_9PELO|nr:unnamed protein product [Caenorhabditis bovis]